MSEAPSPAAPVKKADPLKSAIDKATNTPEKRVSLLQKAGSAVSDPGGAQESGQSALLSKLSKKTGLDLSKLPKLRVATSPGPWAKSNEWKTKALRQIAGAAKSAAPLIATQPSQHTGSVEAMLSALASAKTDLDGAKALVSSGKGGKAGGKTYNRLARRWYEATSGLLYGAIYEQGGKPVESLGDDDDDAGGLDLFTYVLTLKGIKFTAPAVAFAAKGGAEYARALSRDAANLRNALATGSAVPTTQATGPAEKGGGLLGPLLLGAAVIGGIVLLKKRAKKGARAAA